MSVQRSQSSVKRGQQAAYVVRVSTGNNGSASGVTVALTAQPSGQKPAFTSGCAKGNGTASCAVGSVSDKQPVTLHAQIPVSAGATSVTSVELTATASIVTTAKWTPPMPAAETVAVTSAAAPSRSPAASSAGVPAERRRRSGRFRTSTASQLAISAGDASGLFPAINPSGTPSPSPGINPPGGKRNVRPVSDSSALSFVQPGLTGQVAGLIALAVAVMLTVTRLSLRKRLRSRKQGS